MLAVGVSAAALAFGSYFVVRHNLLKDSVTSGESQARRNLAVAPAYLGQGTDQLLAAYGRSSAGFRTAGIRRGRAFSSSTSAGMRQVPAGLRRLVSRGELGYERTDVAGDRYLVVGGPVGRDTELFFFFPENGLRHDLALLRNILAAGVGILVLLAGFAGALLARQTLRPVGRASDAARSLAEGLLETRLPVEGRDEFGSWAQSFNEMAAALETKIADLSAAQARERRFTADVAHELRTPLTALVGEASLLAEHLESMPPESRRPAELLVADVGPSPAARRGPDGDLALGRRPGERSRRDRRARLADRGRGPCAWLGRTCAHRGGGGRADHRPAPARADRGQSGRQRSRAR